MAILDWRRNPVTYHSPCEALDIVGFTTSVGVLLVSGHKITKHTLTTLFFPLSYGSNSGQFLDQKFFRRVVRDCRNLLLEVMGELEKQRTDNCS